MEPSIESPAEEVTRLRDSLNNLRGIMASPALWAGGAPPGIVSTSLHALLGIANELEERVAQRTRELAIANDALRESERELRLIVDSIRGLIAGFTAGGELEFVNRPVLDYFGKTLEELKHWGSGGTTHPEDLPRIVELFTRAVASGEPFEFEVRARRFDGVYRWFQSRGFPLRDPNGHIVRWYNLLIDIDERKRAEEALAASQRDLKLIVDTIPALAWSARPDGSAEFFNQHYLDFIGLSAEQASGWGWTAAVHPDDLNGLAATWQRIMASEAQGEAEARLRRHDGEYRWFLLRASPLHDENGFIVKWYGVNTDIEDRKRAEQELRRSEARKTAILHSALDCIVTIDHEGCITEFNPAAERTFGYRRAEVLGQQLADVIIPPALRESHRQGFTRYLATGEARVLGRRIEMTALRADGSEFPTEIAITRIPLDGPPSFTGYLRDITERKRAEEELRRSEAFLAQAQRLTLTGSLWWKVSTGEITWSDESYRLMGYPTTVTPSVELILNRVHPEDLSVVQETVERSAREGANIDFEHRLVMPDGSIKHVHVVVQHVAGESGPPEFVGAVSDITERKRVEAELRRAYDSFADAQRLSHTGSFITDLVGDDHNWSDETYRIFGFEPGTKVTLQRVREIIHPDDQPSFESVIARAMSGVDVTFSFRIVTARGALKYVRGVAHVIEQIEGRPMFVGALQDVTESMVAEEALNRARSELSHVARITTLSTLTASIAHEVNQPLSGIITNASTCLRMLGADPPDVDGARETARRTIRDGNRASDVITRLRALFSKKELTLEPLDLNDATREVIALSLSDLQRHRVVLQPDLANDLPIITGDRIQLQQVILNLLRNASDAMIDVHERPRLLLIKTEREDGNRVRLSVRDAGMGLPPQSLDSLFDAFYTTKSGGMGIGLFVSRSIVERHQGRLWAEPNEGPGATFSFFVPCQTA